MTLTLVIADDEVLARDKLRSLAEELPDVRVVGEAEDGPTALRMIEELRPDVVLLDLSMPGMSGLEVAKRMRHRPAVVFTTAYDQYAVAAFELQAVDYLLKPFDDGRFKAAIDRARERANLPPSSPTASG